MIKIRYVYTAPEFACLGFTLWFIACFLYVSLSSLTYPFHLEWMEGHTVDIIWRLREGLPFYTKPTLEYVSYIYTPLYFYISAFLSFFTGIDFLPARLLSILSTLGSSVILYKWIQREKGGAIFALIAAGAFLATYKLSGRWFDVARVDSFYVFLMIAGLYVYYFDVHKYSALISSILFAAAFFVKQSALIALLPCMLAGLIIDRNRALITALITGGLIIMGCMYLQSSSNGWFSFYIYDVPAGHPHDQPQVTRFWKNDMLEHCAYFLTLGAAAIILISVKNWRAGLWYFAVAFGFIGSAYASRVHSFGHVNVLIPAHMALALLSALAIIHAKERSRYFSIFLACLLIAQFYNLNYNPKKMVPTEEARKKGEYFISELQKFKGDILSTEIQYIQTRIGKKPYSIGMAGFDILRTNLGENNIIKQEYISEIRAAVTQKKYDAIVMGGFIRLAELRGNYVLDRVIEQPQEFVTGAVFFNKAYIYLPVRR